MDADKDTRSKTANPTRTETCYLRMTPAWHLELLRKPARIYKYFVCLVAAVTFCCIFIYKEALIDIIGTYIPASLQISSYSSACPTLLTNYINNNTRTPGSEKDYTPTWCCLQDRSRQTTFHELLAILTNCSDIPTNLATTARECRRYLDMINPAGCQTQTFPESTEIPGLEIYCSHDNPRLVSKVNISQTDPGGHFETDLAVPNVVHYVWFGGGRSMMFINYLSILSVQRFIKPRAIYIHGDVMPKGPWWNKALLTVPNIYFIRREKPTVVYGKKLIHAEHSADIARYIILLVYGGIYLDTDVLVLKSFDSLRKYILTLARQGPPTLSNAIILSRKSSLFLRLWLETYRTFDIAEWGDHSTIAPNQLHELFPSLVHVVEDRLVTPVWDHAKTLYTKERFDWSQSYAVHVYKTKGNVPKSPEAIEKLDNTLGDLMRYLYFGTVAFV